MRSYLLGCLLFATLLASCENPDAENAAVRKADRDAAKKAGRTQLAWIDPVDRKIAALSPEARDCLGVFLKNGRSRVSDLTVTQLQSIQTCQARRLYHDLE